MDCLPAYTTGALFVSLILIDLFRRDWRQIPVRFLFGAFAVLAMTYICQSFGPTLAWILLGIPVFVLIVGLYFVWSDSQVTVRSQEEQKASCDKGCACCHKKPCRCRKPCPKLPAC